MVKVKNIATVQMGYTFREKLEFDENGAVSVIQMKDLKDNIICFENVVRVGLKKIKESHFVKKYDLVFRSRGLNTTASILLEEPGDVIVGSPLLRIRVSDSSVVMPEYLCWYINQSKAQSYLHSRADGTLQKMINKQVLDDLLIVLPAMKKQKQIVELYNLATRERNLRNQLAEKRRQYVDAVIHAQL
jgi:restriction endonuclease S subunit